MLPIVCEFSKKIPFSYRIVLIMNISLGDSEKHEFSHCHFKFGSTPKKLEIMKSQKNSTVHLFTIKN